MQYAFKTRSGDLFFEDCSSYGSAMIYAEVNRLHRNQLYRGTYLDYYQKLSRLHDGHNYYWRWIRVNPGYAHKLDWQLDMIKITKQLGIENKMEDVSIECYECSESLEPDDVVPVNGVAYCEDCTTVCDDCEERTPTDDVMSDSNTTVCENCYSDHYFTCEDCDSITHTDNCHSIEGDTLVCDSCVYNVNYRYLEGSGEWHYASCECDECEGGSVEDIRYIHYYSYEPDTIFYDDRMGSQRARRNEFYFGAEIEMNTRGGYSTVESAAEFVYNNIGEDYVYLKEDGSIGTGFEFVTHPMTLDYWRNHFPWDNYEKLASMGMLAWDSVDRKCGLHINISRSAFTSSSHLAKFLLFVYREEESLVKFAGRRSRDYADFTYSERELFIEHGKGNTRGSRHVAVNCQNDNRIEFRIFRPSLKRDTVLASIELCHALCHFTAVTTIADIHNGRFDFDAFRMWLTAGDTPTEYPTLVARIDKRVYANDLSSLSINA